MESLKLKKENYKIPHKKFEIDIDEFKEIQKIKKLLPKNSKFRYELDGIYWLLKYIKNTMNVNLYFWGIIGKKKILEGISQNFLIKR